MWERAVFSACARARRVFATCTRHFDRNDDVLNCLGLTISTDDERSIRYSSREHVKEQQSAGESGAQSQFHLRYLLSTLRDVPPAATPQHALHAPPNNPLRFATASPHPHRSHRRRSLRHPHSHGVIKTRLHSPHSRPRQRLWRTTGCRGETCTASTAREGRGWWKGGLRGVRWWSGSE